MDINILPNYIHNSWNEFLTTEIKNELHFIETKINICNFTPSSEKVLRFLKNDLYSLKVVILGQDPYPEEGRATGRCFEVNDLFSWNDKFKQVSLKNIIRLIHKTYNNIEEYDQISSYSSIRNEIKNNKFKILPPDKLFKSWENQGVLLLNTSLTCEILKPSSHKKLWLNFSSKLINYISTKRNLNWFLWGNEACSNEVFINKGMSFKCKHPMLCSKKYENDFLKSNCFKETKAIINWLG